MTDASHAMTDCGTASRHGWQTILAVGAVGAVVFTIALLAPAGILVSIGLVLVVWLAAYLAARRRDSTLAGSLDDPTQMGPRPAPSELAGGGDPSLYQELEDGVARLRWSRGIEHGWGNDLEPLKPLGFGGHA